MRNAPKVMPSVHFHRNYNGYKESKTPIFRWLQICPSNEQEPACCIHKILAPKIMHSSFTIPKVNVGGMIIEVELSCQ